MSQTPYTISSTFCSCETLRRNAWYNSVVFLLYVACTRARDRLLVSGVQPASEFLNDLK
jgi:ATP-dependent exoDNAse (exonuclease V) beta subunit